MKRKKESKKEECDLNILKIMAFEGLLFFVFKPQRLNIDVYK